MFSFKEVEPTISDYNYDIVGDISDVAISDVALIGRGNQNSLIWIGEEYYKENQENLSDIEANLVITDTALPAGLFRSVCVQIVTENPRLLFSKIVTALFVEKPNFQIHPSVVVHPEAKIDPEVYIGPNCTIGRAIIGAGTRISGNTFVHDNVVIGKNCLIDACCVLGADGFGHVKDEHNEWYKFPHIGKTIIEDKVEIGANTYVTKGALGATHIKEGAKIALSVCIGHNVVIGRNSIVLSNAIVGGSTVVGEDVWISITASIKHGLIIGDKATVGMGAVVIKDVPPGKTVLGNPAKELIRK